MANEDQRDYWTDDAGPKWVALQERLDAMLAPVTSALVEAIDPGRDERIFDIGCGTGDLSWQLADRGARVTGIDISSTMIAAAKARAKGNAVFEVADAADYRCPIPFDCAVSRFGVMFFDNPARAFATIRGNLGDDGRLVFACWQAPDKNPWAMIPAMAVIPLLPDFVPPDPEAPGPFALADAERTKSILVDAGYSDIDIAGREIDVTMSASGLEDATDFACQIGPGSRAMSELGEEGREQARTAIYEALAAHAGDGGPVSMNGAIWLVAASA